MLNRVPLLLLFSCVLGLAAPAPPAPPLEKGEALAVGGGDGQIFGFGAFRKESPMGSLACLPWLKLEGADWVTANVAYKCTGAMNGDGCSLPKGHGAVDVIAATRSGCDLAFLFWARLSAKLWIKDYGDGAARARLEDAFGPFLGGRMPPGDALPPLTAAWVGKGDLLRTSPEALLNWLLDPAQDELLRRVRRLCLASFKSLFQDDAWWILSGTVQGEPGQGAAWAVGGNGSLYAVLRLPEGKGREEALARFRSVMIIAPRK